ncbi:MAG TPA: hypothetical protein VFS54_03995 [Solirubrobacterales bacterium]|nr:hypothetical protein [Solirubrobacterales bacterium]
MEPKLSVGETLNRTFSIYRDQAGVLLPVAFWLFLLAAIVEALTIHVLALFWVGIIVSLAVGTLYQGMVVGLVREVREGRPDSSVPELMRSVLPVFWRLLGAGLLAGIGVAGGFFLLVVPGLYLLTVWAVAAPVIVVERRRVTDAFGRSRQLVRGSGWPVLGAVLTGFLIGIAAVLGLTALATAIVEGEIVRLVFTVLAQTVAAPIAALVASVLYFRLLELQPRPASDSSAPAAAPEPPVAS